MSKAATHTANGGYEAMSSRHTPDYHTWDIEELNAHMRAIVDAIASRAPAGMGIAVEWLQEKAEGFTNALYADADIQHRDTRAARREYEAALFLRHGYKAGGAPFDLAWPRWVKQAGYTNADAWYIGHAVMGALLADDQAAVGEWVRQTLAAPPPGP